MKCLLAFFLFVLFPRIGYGQAVNTNTEQQIKNTLVSGGYSGQTDKQLSRIGDAAAVIVTKVLGESNLAPQDIENILIVIHLSFSAPHLVEAPEDRNPRATLFLLRSLNSVTTDEKLRQRISEERKFVLGQFENPKKN